MNIYEAIAKRRSIRRFKQKPVSKETLIKLVDAARMAPSSANLQPLRYIIVLDEKLREQVFRCTKWAGYIAPEGDPAETERPMAYIIVLIDTGIVDNPVNGRRDSGAAIENITLAAIEEGLGTCWLGALDRKKLSDILGITERLIIDSVVALGYPDEDPKVIEATDSIKYFKDESGRLNVPKRKLEDIMEVH